MALGRRALVQLAAAGTLGGCGFRPMYLPAADAKPGDPQLASIYVAVMPERSGQLLRQALQRRFEGTGYEAVPKLYELSGSLGISMDAIGVQRDNSTTRLRMDGTGTWMLRRLDAKRTLLTQGSARSLDGLNNYVNQLFAQDMEMETIQRRIAEAVADKITQQIVIFLQAQAQAAKPA